MIAVMRAPRTRSTGREIGSDTAFEAFFTDGYERLVRAVYLMGGDVGEAEDVAQEAFAKVLERWPRVRSMASPTGYLFRVAMNVFRRARRRSTGAGIAEAAATARHSPEAGMASEPGSVDTRTDVMRALDTLPDDQRAALVLVGWVGLDSTEAGRVLGIRPSSVRARVHRARDAFKEALGDGYG